MMNSRPFFFPYIYMEMKLIEIIDKRKFDGSFKMTITPFAIMDYWIGGDTRRFIAYSGEINFARLHKKYRPLIIRKVNKRETSLGLKISESQYNDANVSPYWLSFEDNDSGLKINVTAHIGDIKLKIIKEILNFFEWK